MKALYGSFRRRAIEARRQAPEVQERARAEIDAVCGEDRSPTWADFGRLPSINMIVKETMRWRPVTPLSFPHTLSQDDWVNGYLLPKGATVFLNVWGLHHDESIFPNPDRFDPSHYEGRHNLALYYAASPDYMQRDHFIYGAGRRLCPGIHLSERSMFLGAVKMLWGFQFEPELDESGKAIPIDTDPITGYTEGFLVCPRAFKCRISPRSAVRAETILREFAQTESEILCQHATP